MVKDQRRQIYPKCQSLSRIRNGPNLSTSLMRPSTQIPLSLPPPPPPPVVHFSSWQFCLQPQAAFALKSGETLNPEILRAESEVVFLCSQHVPFKFPMGYHQVPNMFPIFPMCSPRVFPIHLVLIPYVLHKVLPIFCFISIN
jgi:hypothetical protein